jgi:formamidopyrimidine-DNA glycosylase
MPELPEVETVKKELKNRVTGRTINDVNVLWSKIIDYPSKEMFVQNIKTQTILDVKRRGKWLLIELNKYYLLVHLRMEGKFFIKSKDDIYTKHEHIIFLLDNNKELRYHDTRKFGKMHLIEKNKVYDSSPLNKIGLEPFDKEFNINYLRVKFANKRIPIKTALLDQRIIAGIGNIYANEILFLSKINPTKDTNKLDNRELKLIIENTKSVLRKAVKSGGTTIRTYTALDAKQGTFQDNLLVHGKKDEPCLVCQTLIVKVFINGRGTYYCSKCQIDE